MDAIIYVPSEVSAHTASKNVLFLENMSSHHRTDEKWCVDLNS